jgi:hypothetical protein
MVLLNKITITRTIALVNMLAQLHNFYLGDLILDPLAADVNYIINKYEDGYLVMDDGSNDHGITMPTALMDVGHHFDEVPRRIQRGPQTKNTNENQIMPREILHDIVLRSHARRPNTT